MKKLLLALSAVVIFGCSDNSSPAEGLTNASEATETEKNGGVNVITGTIISDPANDPYSVENMSKAMRRQVLAKPGVDSQEVEQLTLEPNYLYVRFLAEGKRGAAELKAYDTSLVLFKHPLDYKPIPKPVVYIDPSLPDSIIPLFATVPVNYKFGPTKYEILKELFLVEPLDDDCDDEDDCSDDADSTTTVNILAKRAAEKSSETVIKKLSNMGVSLRDIEWESLSMTGNLNSRFASQILKPGEGPVLGWSLFGGGKKLGGQLKFVDDDLGVQPLVGVRVTGGYSYYWREAHTDKDGKFRIPEKWTFKIDFEANFDSDDFLLEDGHSSYGEDLEIEHNNYKSDWNETFTGHKAKWCVVWTAAYQYWYGDNFGLKRPRQNTWYNWSLDIEVYYKEDKVNDYYDENKKGTQGEYSFRGTTEDIGILVVDIPSWQIFGTTIHEIAHTSHYWNMKTTSPLQPQSSEFVSLGASYKDTYARGIENYFTNEKYKKRRRDYNSQYTGLVEDLMGTNETSKCKRNDVKGFSITGIETAFFQNKEFSTMKGYLMNKNPNGKNGVKYTQTGMDNLFKCWGLE